ncbi:MAG: N-acetylmuramoyl-L-alanine amidase [Spirochaetales bacterium]|nr:N-acetylmuramoyl-L-alanine amidase [Spirochaetales bacterium]
MRSESENLHVPAGRILVQRHGALFGDRRRRLSRRIAPGRIGGEQERAAAAGRHGSFREVDANVDIAGRVAEYLEIAGIQVDLLPATVPPGYRADAFVSIHADGAYRSGVRGWKIATP